MAAHDIIMAAAGGSTAANYIEDVFSTWLYTGNGASNPITNGIDLAGKGGLVWFKNRTMSYNAGSVWNKGNHLLMDTARGVSSGLSSNLTNAAQTEANHLTSFNSNGFTLGANWSPNNFGEPWASWTFRKQPKFFDVQTFTSNSSYGATVSHNLGSAPGCILIKCTGNSEYWIVWHRSLGNDYQLELDSTAAQASVPGWITTSSTSITITNGYLSYANTSYVAYFFAHNAGGFGLTGTDNVISCGSFTTDGSGNATVNLGYEMAYLNLKCATAAEGWILEDSMRGASYSSTQGFYANTSGAEFSTTPIAIPTATGFVCQNGLLQPSSTYIYIAIRRGPMKTPTSGTSVFTPVTATIANPDTATTNFPVDLLISGVTNPPGSENRYASDRLRGTQLTAGRVLYTNLSNAEAAIASYGYGLDSNTTISDKFLGPYAGQTGNTAIYWAFRRAPSFFDEVCYTGNSGSTGGPKQYIPHNLGVAPELYIVKARNLSTDWTVGTSLLTATSGMFLNSTSAAVDNSVTARYWNGYPTSTSLNVGDSGYTNESGYNFVAYLFASCPGVSKVGSYSGTGATQTISCGFAARFVLIKRTDSAGNWWAWDTTRGMVAGTDPRFAWNLSDAPTNANWVYTNASGFQIVTTDASVNASGGSYIYLAIA